MMESTTIRKRGTVATRMIATLRRRRAPPLVPNVAVAVADSTARTRHNTSKFRRQGRHERVSEQTRI